MSRKRKRVDRVNNDPSTLQQDDVMIVLHSKEVDLIETLLCTVLEEGTDKEEKRTALNILNHIQGGD